MLHTFHKVQFRQVSVLINKLLTTILDLSQIFLFIHVYIPVNFNIFKDTHSNKLGPQS